MSGGIGDDEFAFGRGEVSVGDVDGDALFALVFESVGEQAQVDMFESFAFGAASNLFELIFKNGF